MAIRRVRGRRIAVDEFEAIMGRSAFA